MTKSPVSDPALDSDPRIDDEGQAVPVPASDFLQIPARLEMSRDSLCYQYWSEDPPWQSGPRSKPGARSQAAPRSHRLLGPTGKNPTAELLIDFVRLADAQDKRILAFARRWGVLDLCNHGRPNTDPFAFFLKRLGHGPVAPCPPLKWVGLIENPDVDQRSGRELTDDWRHWAKRAAALLAIARTLKSGKPGTLADWETFLDERWIRDGRDHKGMLEVHGTNRTLDEQWLRYYVNLWVLTGQVAPLLISRKPGLQLTRYSSGPRATLFGTIGLQLMFRIGGGMVIPCDECGRPSDRSHLPSPSRRNFCSKCGLRASWRQAQERHRDRKARAPELAGTGPPVSKMVRETGAHPKTAKKSIKKGGR